MVPNETDGTCRLMGQVINVFRIGNLEANTPFYRFRRRWEVIFYGA
jgi:hypothetical protein